MRETFNLFDKYGRQNFWYRVKNGQWNWALKWVFQDTFKGLLKLLVNL